jgi:hypothetical protein
LKYRLPFILKMLKQNSSYKRHMLFFDDFLSLHLFLAELKNIFVF